VGSHDGNLYAVDSRSGRELWRFATGDEVKSSPSIAGDTVVFGSFDGNVYGLDAKTGSERCVLISRDR